MSRASYFSECSYVYRRGDNEGNQCLRKANLGFCKRCYIGLKINIDNYHTKILRENIRVDNFYMIDKCMALFLYSIDDLIKIKVKQKIYQKWIVSKSQDKFIINNLLISYLPLVNDVINIIKDNCYHIEYHVFINIYNQL